MRLKPEIIVQLINPLAEANGNKEKMKTEMKVVMENIYCRRLQPTDQSRKQTEFSQKGK